jgi:hypothetical protein
VADVTGSKDAARLAAELRAIGNRKLRAEVTRALTATAKPIIDAGRAAGVRELPKAGGLNHYFDNATYTAKVRGGKHPTLTVRADQKGHDMRGADRGMIRHPVYGHKDRKWAYTEVPARIWTRAMRRAANKRVVRELVKAADRVIAGVR